MIHPIEMTLATGTTVYAGVPDSDERIQSREVRVSVTYRIEEQEDFDLAGFASARAADVERARIAAMQRIEKRTGRDRRVPCEAPLELSDSDTSFDPSDPDLEPPDDEDNDAAFAPDPFPEEADYLHARCGPAPNSCSGNGERARNGGAAHPPAPPDGTQRFSGADQVTLEETDWATKPQVLALGSHFKRLGLSPENQTALLRARYGKFRPERLTKAEAAGLMRCLERNEWEPAESSAH